VIPQDKIDCCTAFGYFGGKFEMSKELVPKIPAHDNYIELFAGGLSMFFRKSKAKWNLVNDLNSDIANFYWVVSHPYLYEKFKHSVYYLINSRKIYDKAEDISLKELKFPDTFRAALYLFYLAACFNKRIGTGFSDKPDNWDTNIVNVLELTREKLNGVLVENLDFSDITNKYKDKNNTFWYIDPPYVVADTEKYYKYNFTERKHEHLKMCIDGIMNNSNSTIMISYDDLPLIRKLYSEKPYIINEIETMYASNGQKATELVITNYEPPNKQVTLFEL